MMRKKRLLTGAELGNCLLCRIGYDIKEPTDEFILKTTQCWKSQTDFDAYYLRLEIRDFLLLLHNSAVYAQAKGYAEGLNVVLINTQIGMKAKELQHIITLKNLYDKAIEDDEQVQTLPICVLEKELNDFNNTSREDLKELIDILINAIADHTITAFTDSLTFILNCDAVVDLFAKYFNLDLHTYKTKTERTALIWQAVDSFDHKGIKTVIDDAKSRDVIDDKTHKKAINNIEKASRIDTREATEDEKQEVLNALKEIKTQADFIHLREWIIKKMIKTQAFI